MREPASERNVADEALNHQVRRDRGLRHAGVVGAVVRLISAFIALVTVRVTVDALGTTSFGVVATLGTMTALLGFADLGIGQGLLTKLAVASGRDDGVEMRALVSSAWSTLVALGAVVVAIGVVLTFALPWTTLLGVPGGDVGEVRAAVLTFFIATGLAIPSTIGQRVQIGLQRGAHVSGWLLVTSVALLVAACIAALVDAPLWGFMLATAGTPVLIAFAQTVYVLGRSHTHLRPRVAYVTRGKVRELLSVSGLFLALNIAIAISFQSDALIVSAVLGASAAAVFAVTLRMFTTLSGLFGGITQQMWPALAEALSRGDLPWARSRFLRVLCITLALAGGLALVLVVFGQTFARIWVGEDLVPPQSLLVAFAVWTVYSLGMTQVSYLLNASELIRPQIYMAVAMASVNIPLSIFLAREVGIEGPLYGSLVAHFFCTGIPAVILVRRVLRGDHSMTGSSA